MEMPGVNGSTSHCPLMIRSLKTDVNAKCEQGLERAAHFKRKSLFKAKQRLFGQNDGSSLYGELLNTVSFILRPPPDCDWS